ncbi:MAG: LptF/LptG family permease [Myxococcales bacterium]
MRILGRYIAFEYLKAFVGTLLSICAIYLVVEYVDRARIYTGKGWLPAVLELYANKGILFAYQFAPAAMLLAAGITLAGLRRRGEYTAIRALAVGPFALLAPLMVVCLSLVGGAMAMDELLVGRASIRVDSINTRRFKHWGDWRLFYGETRWFRGKRNIYHLRRGSADRGFEDVTIYSMSDGFKLSRRIDAARMEAAEQGAWRLIDGSQRDFAGATSPLERFEERVMRFEEDPSAFRITKGRPEQLSVKALREQIALRQNVGLHAERYRLALHNKFAYPLAGVPGVLLAFALALRPGRRGRLSSALAEGFLIIVGLWALLVVFKAAAFAGYVSAAVASWGPVVMLAAVSGLAVKRFVK